ncbi:MAG: Trk system potassium transporter TrkA [Ruminococcaceae bacterium]|nr:Trk system potassium transporter TrkA [Oscillospiraceae bacterium]
MKIIIGGCGNIGENLIANFVNEGHDAVVLDSSPQVITEITNVYDVMGVCGNAADYETLESAGIRQADLFIAAAGSDELNMLSCFLAKRMGVPYTIARIRNPEYNDASLGFVKNELGLAMSINPEALAARELFDILMLPSAAKIETFSGRALEIVQLNIKEDSPLNNITLKDLRMKYKAKVLVCTVQRDDEVYIPGGDFLLMAGDKIGITASPAEIENFLRHVGLMKKKARKVMILGGNRTAYYLAKMLIAGGTSVKIVEADPTLASELSETLPEAVIINGDYSHHELLLEEGIESADAVVTLTDNDETNILLSIYAETQKVPKVITQVNRDEMQRMARKLGLDTVISPKKVIANVLVQYARALANSIGSSNIETLYKLMDGKAEALEFNVRQASKVTDIPLKDLHLKSNILIAGIIRGRKTIVPGGMDMIQVGDKVIVMTSGYRLSDLSDIIE